MAEIQDQEVKIFLPEWVIEFDIEVAIDAFVYFLLFFESLHPLLIQIFELYNLHCVKVSGVLLSN